MRVLFQGYSTYAQNKSGGVQVRMRQLASHLRKSGVDVDFFDHNTTDISQYDILHIFSLNAEHYNLVNYAHRKGVKVVLSSIVTLADGWKIDLLLTLVHHPVLTLYNMQQSILKLCDAIIVETPKELDFICKHFRIAHSKLKVIPNGIEQSDNVGREHISSIVGDKDYVLCVGRFDRNKNQLNVIKAMIDTDIDVVFIGGPVTADDKYYQECLTIAKGKNNFHFIGWVDNNSLLLKSAYSNAKVFLFPSYHETFGLVLLEAAVAGANLVVSKSLPILDFPSMNVCTRIDPNKLEDIRNKVMKAFVKEKDVNQINRILKYFSWKEVVDQHIDLYKSL